MTWIRSLKALGKYPMYLILTLLGVLPILVLLFPLVGRLSGLALDMLAQATLYGIYGKANTEGAALLAEDLMAIAMPLMTVLVLALGDLFLLRPLSLQFIGEVAAREEMPEGFAGRGLRRLWWRPCVLLLMMVLIAFFIYATAPVPLTLAMNLSRLLDSDVLFWSIPVLFGLFLLAVLTLMRLIGVMALAASAQEEIGLFRALGRAFRRTFRCFGRLLGACFSSLGVLLIPLYLAVSLLLFFAAPYVLTGTPLDMDRGRMLETFSVLFRQSTILLFCIGLFSWMRSSFLDSYAAHLTAECIAREQPAPSLPEVETLAEDASEESLPAEDPSEEASPDDGDAPSDPAEP